MHNKRLTVTPPLKMKGFSLIEFLVASALSMIVLMAVTSTYFTARNLNNAATSRLSVQQDLRSASTLIVRDARMAGSFGCFSMANQDPAAVVADVAADTKQPFNRLQSHISISSGKMVPITTGNISASGFTGNALIFQYGIDATGSDANIASSCSAIAKSANITNLNTAKAALNISGNAEDGTISILKHMVTAYAVGSINHQQGLYRFQLNNNGTWDEPQLLMKDIQSMDIRYLYIDNTNNCTNLIASQTSSETFRRQQNLTAPTTPGAVATPALIQIRLNGIDNTANYNIEAAVRGGNVCVNQSV